MIEKFDVGTLYLLSSQVSEFNHIADVRQKSHGDGPLKAAFDEEHWKVFQKFLSNPPPAVRRQFPSVSRQAIRLSQLTSDTMLSILRHEMTEFSRRFEEELRSTTFFTLRAIGSFTTGRCYLAKT